MAAAFTLLVLILILHTHNSSSSFYRTSVRHEVWAFLFGQRRSAHDILEGRSNISTIIAAAFAGGKDWTPLYRIATAAAAIPACRPGVCGPVVVSEEQQSSLADRVVPAQY